MSLFRKAKAVKLRELPTSRVDYPEGTCVVTESGMYYLTGTTKFLIDNNAVFRSWSFPLVCNSTDSAISHYKKSLKPLNYRPGTIVRDVHNFELYVSSRNGFVPLRDADLYRYLDINEEDVLLVSSSEIKKHRRLND